MLTGLANEIGNLTVDILEGFMLAFVGVKPSRRSKTYKRQHRMKMRHKRMMLNQRAQMRLAARLFENLPRDVAISVLNDVKRYGIEA